ncbi:MAG: rsbW, partial [Marmoricola sp.]|nr:rsbW [Marmoricola sp.]
MSHSPDVELRLPAESAYVAVLRMTTAGLAARLDFTLDDIEDLRMAVGEACALVLEHADPGGDLHAWFDLSDGS